MSNELQQKCGICFVFSAHICDVIVASSAPDVTWTWNPLLVFTSEGDTDTGIKSGMTSETMTQAEVRGRVGAGAGEVGDIAGMPP